jgi:hypothetical protein
MNTDRKHQTADSRQQTNRQKTTEIGEKERGGEGRGKRRRTAE